jgi:hypothetical protein
MFDINLDPILAQLGLVVQSPAFIAIILLILTIVFVGLFTDFYKNIKKLWKNKIVAVVVVIVVSALMVPLFQSLFGDLLFKEFKTSKKIYKIGDDVWVTVDATKPYYFYATLYNPQSKKYDLLVYPQKKSLNNLTLMSGKNKLLLFKVNGPGVNGKDTIRGIISRRPIDISEMQIASKRSYTKSLLTQNVVVINPIIEDSSSKSSYADVNILGEQSVSHVESSSVERNKKIKLTIDSRKYAQSELANISLEANNCKHIDVFDVTVNRGKRKIKHYNSTKPNKEYRFSYRTSKKVSDIGRHLLVAICSDKINLNSNDFTLEEEKIKGTTLYHVNLKGKGALTDYEPYLLTF